MEPLDGMFGDSFEDISEPGLGIDVVQFCCTDEGVHDGGPVAAAVGAREQATKHGILSSVVVADDEEGELFDALLDSLEEQFDPKTPTESLLVEKIAVLLWRERHDG